MILYLLHDTDPNGGYFAASQEKPDVARERRTIDEIRVVPDFPDDLWRATLAGELPIDPDLSNDSTWLKWWKGAEPYWAA